MIQTLILGAGGFARELYHYGYFDGFLDDNVDLWGKEVINGKRVLGSINSHPLGGNYLVCGVGDPKLKKAFVERALKKGGIFDKATKGPATWSGSGVFLDTGTIICPGSTLTTNIKIGKHALVNINCTIGHDVVVGDYCTLSPGVHLSGYSSIDIGTEVGTGAVILPKVKVGKWCVIGAGAVVTKDVPDFATVVGVPGKVIKINEDPSMLSR